MTWASARTISPTGDEAYCLMGIFQVNMLLVYGECMEAFKRLQVEIIKQSADESMFAWTGIVCMNECMQIYAKSTAEMSCLSHERCSCTA